MNKPRLPPEIWDMIIDILAEHLDWASLYACILTCRPLVPQCKRHLHHGFDLTRGFINIHSRKHLTQAVLVMKRYRPRWMRLTLDARENNDSSWICSALVRVALRMPKLDSITFQGIDFFVIAANPSFYTSLRVLQSRCPSLRLEILESPRIPPAHLLRTSRGAFRAIIMQMINIDSMILTQLTNKSHFKDTYRREQAQHAVSATHKPPSHPWLRIPQYLANPGSLRHLTLDLVVPRSDNISYWDAYSHFHRHICSWFLQAYRVSVKTSHDPPKTQINYTDDMDHSSFSLQMYCFSCSNASSESMFSLPPFMLMIADTWHSLGFAGHQHGPSCWPCLEVKMSMNYDDDHSFLLLAKILENTAALQTPIFIISLDQHSDYVNGIMLRKEDQPIASKGRTRRSKILSQWSFVDDILSNRSIINSGSLVEVHVNMDYHPWVFFQRKLNLNFACCDVVINKMFPKLAVQKLLPPCTGLCVYHRSLIGCKCLKSCH